MHRLLIVEDEELFKELCVATDWEKFGFVLCGAAENGDEALATMGKTAPDAVMTDIRMPGLDGLGLLEAIGTMPEERRPLVVMLSGHSEFDYAKKALRLGAFDYLLKPLDDGELESVMARLRAALAEKSSRVALGEAASAERTIAFFREFAPAGPRDVADAYVERAVAEIRDRYVEDLAADEVGSRLGISGGHLARIFKAKTGLTFSEYLARFRIKRACDLLRDPVIRVGEVADLAGYADQRHFAHLFRKLVGMTPTEFREGRFSSHA